MSIGALQPVVVRELKNIIRKVETNKVSQLYDVLKTRPDMIGGHFISTERRGRTFCIFSILCGIHTETDKDAVLIKKAYKFAKNLRGEDTCLIEKLIVSRLQNERFRNIHQSLLTKEEIEQLILLCGEYINAGKTE